jgi:P-type E1-E2 ATPase
LIQLVEKLQVEGKTTVIISVNNSIIGIIGLLDTPKHGAKEAVSALKSLGIEPVMLTGAMLYDSLLDFSVCKQQTVS